MRTKGAIIGILGLWLIAAGLIGLGVVANVWNDIIVGVIVAVLGFAMANTGNGVLSGILGIWMIISAFIPALHSGAGLLWDDVVVGIILAIAGFSTRRAASRASEIRRAA